MLENNDIITDWTKSISKNKFGQFDVIIIPKNTLLHHGMHVYEKNNLYGRKMNNFFGNLPVASYYAFSSDYSKGEHGKVITYMTVDDLILLDMDSLDNYDRLYKLCSDVPKYIDKDVIEYAFGYNHKEKQLKRYSHPLIDCAFVKWLSKINLQGIDGYSYIKLPGFHSEVFIFKIRDKINRYPLEYRFVKTYKREHIIETFNGEYTGNDIPVSSLSYNIPKEKFISENDPISYDTHTVYPRTDPNDVYYPRDIVSDKFLLKEPFISLRHDYQKTHNII